MEFGLLEARSMIVWYLLLVCLEICSIDFETMDGSILETNAEIAGGFDDDLEKVVCYGCWGGRELSSLDLGLYCVQKENYYGFLDCVRLGWSVQMRPVHRMA